MAAHMETRKTIALSKFNRSSPDKHKVLVQYDENLGRQKTREESIDDNQGHEEFERLQKQARIKP